MNNFFKCTGVLVAALFIVVAVNLIMALMQMPLWVTIMICGLLALVIGNKAANICLQITGKR